MLASRFLSTFAAFLLLAAPGLGAILLEDYFDYGPSNLAGGYGSWQDTTGRVRYEAGVNLSFTNPAYAVGSNAGTGTLNPTSGAGSPRGAQLNFDTSGTTGEVWFSALMAVESNLNASGERAVIAFNTSAYSNGALNGDAIGIFGDAGGTPVPGFWDDSASTETLDAASPLSADTTYLLVARLNVGVGPDELDYWVFDEADSFTADVAGLGTPNLSTTSAEFGDSLANIWIGRYESITVNVDSLRVSDLSGDAGVNEVLLIPEPASIALLLGGSLLVMRRRRAVSR